jgi:hypothetical protein
MRRLSERGLPVSEYANVAEELVTGRRRPDPPPPPTVEELAAYRLRAMWRDELIAKERQQS